MKLQKLYLLVICFLGIAVVCTPADCQEKEADSKTASLQPIDFDRDVKPIFDNHCLACHGPDKAEEFRIDIQEETMEHVKKGDVDGSYLYELLVEEDEDYIMPPVDSEEGIEPLSDSQIATVKRWIEEGALWSGEQPASVEGSDAEKAKEPEEENIWFELWKVVGVFHPAMVHFPIALLMVSALFAIGSLRGSYAATDVSYYCLWLGALSSVVAAAFGWSFTMKKGTPANDWQTIENVWDTSNKFFEHGVFGLLVAVLSMIVAIMAMSARRRDPDQAGSAWKFATLILAGLVGWVGHEGGKLDDKNLYNPVWEFVDKVQNPDGDGKVNENEKDEPEKADQDGESDKDQGDGGGDKGIEDKGIEDKGIEDNSGDQSQPTDDK